MGKFGWAYLGCGNIAHTPQSLQVTGMNQK
jgi:hypothetical protein